VFGPYGIADVRRQIGPDMPYHTRFPQLLYSLILTKDTETLMYSSSQALIATYARNAERRITNDVPLPATKTAEGEIRDWLAKY